MSERDARPTPVRPSRCPILILGAMVTALACSAGIARAQSTADLTRISVEDLMRIEVTSVSRKERPLATSPAAVFVLTHEDIRRSGATSLPELLRLVPGLHVARIDGSKWAVSARGFNGRFANKLLVLVDGRTVYSPLYSGVYWDEVDLSLGDVDRIEIIRGPGATMWGANAVNGVVNVITRPAGATRGTSVSLTTGSEERASASVRYGGTAGDDLSWRVWGKAFDRGPLARADGSDAHDGWRMARSGFRADYRASERDEITVQGDVNAGRVDQTSGTVQLAAPYRRLFDERAEVHGRNVVARWTRTHSPRSETTVQAFVDHTSRREYLVGFDRTTVDVEYQRRQAAGARHDLVWGLGYRRGRSLLTNSEMVFFADTDRGEWLASGFAEDEIAMVPERLTVTLGLKVERNGYSGVELQPNARALWSVSAHDAIWGAVTRGVRTPSLLENGANVDVAAAPGPQGLPVLFAVVGRGNADVEELWAAEIGYRRHWSRLSLEVSAFRNAYSDLTSLTPGAPELVLSPAPHVRVPYLIDSDLRGLARGVEAATTWFAVPGWTLTAGYAYLHVDLTTGGIEQAFGYEAAEDDSPRHQLVLRTQGSIGRRWEADATLHARGASDGDRVAAFSRLDLRGGWKASEHLAISVSGVNLLDARHAEFLSVLNEEISQPRRSVLLETRWTF